LNFLLICICLSFLLAAATQQLFEAYTPPSAAPADAPPAPKKPTSVGVQFKRLEELAAERRAYEGARLKAQIAVQEERSKEETRKRSAEPSTDEPPAKMARKCPFCFVILHLHLIC
jgi:hypothetical protein